MEKPYRNEIVSVLLSGPYNKTFDYIIFENTILQIGQIVLVPFGRQEILGMIIGKSKDNVPENKLKKIKSKINLPIICNFYIDFISFFSNWNCVDKGAVLKMILSPFDKQSLKNIDRKNYKIIDEDLCNLKKEKNLKCLNYNQKIASEKLIKDIKNSVSQTFLLDGVAGSGKTETYFEAVKQCIKNDKQVLILLPEIGLTSDWELRFYKRFGFRPLIWHSGITKSKKKKIWLSAINKRKMVLVGARSALFVPMCNLGLIVIDEEHDISFKQEEGIRYHARDMAIYLASKSNASIILSSATPSIESLYNVKVKKYLSLALPKRATGSDLPEIRIINLKKDPPKKGNWLSEVMLKELTKRYNNNEQSLLFLNRRGYSPLTLCKDCGFRIQCNNCNAWLVEHKKKDIYLCHHCGFRKKITKICEKCNSSNLVSCGPGIEKINEEIKKSFPNAIIENISSDNIKNLNYFKEVLNKIVEGKVQFIIGTQLLSKGYDLPKLNFVGIVDGDIGIYGGDLRASEKCFQLLTQVSGRAGRHLKNKKGLVYLQTYHPDNSVINTIKNMDRKRFLEEELIFRKSASMPPFKRLISIIISSKLEKELNSFSFYMLDLWTKYKNVEILGPAPAPLNYVRGRFRNRFLIRSEKNVNLQNIVRKWIDLIKKPKSVRISIDVDPYNFL